MINDAKPLVVTTSDGHRYFAYAWYDTKKLEWIADCQQLLITVHSDSLDDLLPQLDEAVNEWRDQMKEPIRQ